MSHPAARPAAAEELAALYLAATTAPSMTAPQLRLLVDHFGSLERTLSAPDRQLRSVPGVLPKLARGLQGHVARQRAQALRTVRQSVSAGLGVLTWEHAAYPPSLFDDPHGCGPILFLQGQLPPQLGFGSYRVRSCAIVGRRTASPGAIGFARDLARSVTREGVVVVSGLALGIDAAAHEGALEGRQRDYFRDGSAALNRYRWTEKVASTPLPAATVAVLGGGHGHVYPAANVALARRILGSGGALLSQWAPDVTPRKHHFPLRNRIVSGLARVVAVVEAGLKSGTNSTVDHALEQGRTLMAVPAPPWQEGSRGCVEYLRQGATLLVDEVDLLAQYRDLYQLTPGALRAVAAHAARQGHGTQPDLGMAPAVAHDAGRYSAMELQATTVVRQLLKGQAELSLDALLRRVPLGPGALLALLARLELEGQVEATPSGRYRKRGGA